MKLTTRRSLLKNTAAAGASLVAMAALPIGGLAEPPSLPAVDVTDVTHPPMGETPTPEHVDGFLRFVERRFNELFRNAWETTVPSLDQSVLESFGAIIDRGDWDRYHDEILLPAFVGIQKAYGKSSLSGLFQAWICGLAAAEVSLDECYINVAITEVEGLLVSLFVGGELAADVDWRKLQAASEAATTWQDVPANNA